MIDFFVIDTNSLISSALIANSTNRKIGKAIALGELAISNSTMGEFIELLFRKKFDKYFSNDNER